MAWFAAAIPVLPGKADEARKIGDELKQRKARYDELNRQAGLKRHVEVLQETPMGAFMITIYEADDLSKLGRAFGTDEYDTWWTGHVKELYGFDLRDPGLKMPKATVVHEWSAADAK